jgi:bacterioferritin
MRADAKVVDYLNQALKHELTAINQYWLHYRILDNGGYKELAKTWRQESIEEMRHADTLTARILFLEGYPNMQSINPLSDFLETQLELIKQVGVELYAQKHLGRLQE